MRQLFGMRAVLAVGVLTSAVLAAGEARAGGTIKIDDTRWFSIGGGLRTSFDSIENGAPSGKDRSKDFQLDSIRLYTAGQLSPLIKFEFNTDYDGAGNVQVLDAVAKLEFHELFNVWVGRLLPPSDRSNLSGPYYANVWDFPFVQQYPAIFAGRDDGAAVWGQVDGGRFKYQVGAFEGTGRVGGAVAPNQKDSLEYAARLVVNLLAPEPGYYNSSTYYGAKDVLAIGVAYMTQADALGTAVKPGNFTGSNIDVLFEKNLTGTGVVNLEGAYYNYDRDKVLQDSHGYFVLASFLFPQKLGIGQLQPVARYQSLTTDKLGAVKETTVSETDIGLNYIIDGHNARISVLYGGVNQDKLIGKDFNLIRIGLQIQI